MPHRNKIKDLDAAFEVNPITREIKNVSTTKRVLVQYDHNSERFTFSLPRYIEGHDMTECNRVQVHYETNGGYTDRVELTQLEESTENPGYVVCTWLISRNATRDVGALKFSLRFSCVNEETGECEYSWSTGIFNGISVSEGMYNAEGIIEQNPDAFDEFVKAIVKNTAEPIIKDIVAEAISEESNMNYLGEVNNFEYEHEKEGTVIKVEEGFALPDISYDHHVNGYYVPYAGCFEITDFSKTKLSQSCVGCTIWLIDEDDKSHTLTVKSLNINYIDDTAALYVNEPIEQTDRFSITMIKVFYDFEYNIGDYLIFDGIKWDLLSPSVRIDKKQDDVVDSTYEFSGKSNTINRYSAPAMTTLSFTFGNEECDDNYTSELSFNSGETPPEISYTDSGTLYWLGTDCSIVDGLSIFAPTANKHYDIVFYFNGTCIVGLVNGFEMVSKNNVEYGV